MRRPMFLAAAAVVVSLGACTTKGSTPPTLGQDSLADSAEQVILGVRTLLTNQGIQRGELFADSAYVFDNGSRFELRKVKATFNTVLGAKDGTMAADRGRYSTSLQMLEGFGHALVTTVEGRRLSSPHLRYNQSTNEISSDSAFTAVQQDGSVISGIGFRADPQLNHVTILKGTSGRSTFSVPAQ